MVLKVRLIPTVLFMNGIAVKSKRFTEYRNVGSYLNVVRVYRSRGVDELIFVDITATNQARLLPEYVVSEISKECNMPLTVGGGVTSLSDITHLLTSSADKVSINSFLLKNQNFLGEASEKFGSANLVASMDVKKIDNNYIVFGNGGRLNSAIDAVTWAQNLEACGAGEILLTSIDKDGTMTGYDLNLIRQIVDNVRIPVIAAGGAGEPSHVVDAVLKGGASAVSAASIFHFTQHTPKEVKEAMAREGISVRL